MNALIIASIPTRTEATIEILCLLLVAGFIGYVTAWLYSKSIYSKRVKELEAKRDELKSQMSQQLAEQKRAEKALTEKEKELNRCQLKKLIK